MSIWVTAITAAKSAVAAPTVATTPPEIGASSKRTADRDIMKTPAVTMVAAWMRADTGVGPSMASGSHM